MLRLRTLGTVELSVRDGQAHPLHAQPKRLGLLVYLATGSVQSYRRRDVVLSLFWPDLGTDRARGALRQAMYVLRRDLGEGVIRSRGEEELGVDAASIWFDVAAFEAALAGGDYRIAAELYRGDFLEGFFVPGAGAGFDEWAAKERARLRALASRCLWVVAEDTSRGDPPAAAEWIRRAVELAPDDEVGVRDALAKLEALGNRAGALQLYQEFRERLLREYQAEPATQTQAVAAALRQTRDPVPVRAPAVTNTAGTGSSRPNEPTPEARVIPRSRAIPGHRLVRVGLLAGALLTVLPLAWRASRPDPMPRRVERLAVLPLMNATGDSALTMTEALTQDLISSLITAGFRVTGYYSVAKYRGTSPSLARVGRELGVDAVATWMLRRKGGNLQVSLEVSRAASGEGLWTSTTWSIDSLALADVAAGTARELVTRFAPHAPRRPIVLTSTSPAAAEAKLAYLLGMQAYYKDTAAFTTALGHFERAVAADSTFAPGWAGLGFVLAWAVDYGRMPLGSACARGRAAIARALTLASDLGLAHLAHARIVQLCDWNWREAEASYRKAIALEPNAIAYASYGWLLEWYLGRAVEGAAMGDTAVSLDPGWALMHAALAWRLRGADSLSRAATEARTTLALDPSIADSWWILAEVSLRRGDVVSAEREALRHKAMTGAFPAGWTTLGEIYARTGREKEARAYLAELREQQPMTGPDRVAMARTQLALGERGAALATLEAAVRDRVFIIPYQPYWAPIRAEPRFKAMMRAMGL